MPDWARRPPDLRTMIRSWILASLVAGGIILASSRGTVDRMSYGDGLIYRYVAAHLSTDPQDVDPVVAERGSSLRYGRIGLPAVIWTASAGRPAAMPYAHPAVIAAAAGAAGAATAALFPGLGPLAALLPFAAPGFSLSVAGGYAEVLAMAFALWAVWFGARRRWWPSALLLALAMLTRDNAGAALIGLVVWFSLRREFRGAAILTSSLLPVAAWHVFVARRYGHLPLLDPYLRVATDTIAPPFVAVWRSLADSSVGSAVTAGVHLAAAAVAIALWRASPLGAVAAAAGLQVLSAGPFAWHFVGDAIRASVFLEGFVLFAVLRSRWPAAAPAP